MHSLSLRFLRVGLQTAHPCLPLFILLGLIFPALCLIAPTALSATFTDNGDGTVTDATTGLIWMRCAMKQTWNNGTCMGTAGRYTWDEAYMLTSSFAGQSDWRLPNIRELNSIVNRATSNPAIDTIAFPETPSDKFYSSTDESGTSKGAFYVDFSDGTSVSDSFLHYFGDTPQGHARLVRAGLSIGQLRDSRITSDYVDHGNGTVTHTPKVDPSVKTIMHRV